MVGTIAKPVTGTLCGLSAALSVTVRFALRVPPSTGENVTLMAQDALTARELAPLGQVFDELKSPELVPVVAMLLMLIGAVPMLDNVIVCGALNVPTF